MERESYSGEGLVVVIAERPRGGQRVQDHGQPRGRIDNGRVALHGIQCITEGRRYALHRLKQESEVAEVAFFGIFRHPKRWSASTKRAGMRRGWHGGTGEQ